MFEPANNRTLPRLIGVRHEEPALANTLELIDSLPAGSKIGLEHGGSHPYFRKKYPFMAKLLERGKPDFFRAVEEYARKRGHQVVWLESPKQYDKGIYRRFFEQTNRVAQYEYQWSRPRAFFEKLKKFWFGIRAGFDRTMHFERSTNMATRIQTHEWQKTDLAITGYLHAEHVSGILGIPVEQRIIQWHTEAQSRMYRRNAERDIRNDARFREQAIRALRR